MQNEAFTLDERTSISLGFDAGNYGNAYHSEDWEAFAEFQRMDQRTKVWRIAALLGFFASYSLNEIPLDMRDDYDQAYWSPVGAYVVNVARYIDSRDEEYREESEGF